MRKASWFCGIAFCLVFTAAHAVWADSYYVGETLTSGGVVSAVNGASVSVIYDISKMTYIDSYYNNDNFGAITATKNVVNAIDHTGASVTRSLIGFSSIDSLSGYATSSVVLNVACTRNTDTNWSVRAYALTQSWTEGTSVSGGQTRFGLTPDGATWSTMDGTTSWSNTSGTYTSLANATGDTTTTVGGGSAYDASAHADAASAVEGAWATLDLTAIWSKASVYGVVLMDYCISTGVTEDQSTTAMNGADHVTEKFATDDWTVASTGDFANEDASPYVTVTFTAVPEPATVGLLAAAAIGWCGYRLRRRWGNRSV